MEQEDSLKEQYRKLNKAFLCGEVNQLEYAKNIISMIKDKFFDIKNYGPKMIKEIIIKKDYLSMNILKKYVKSKYANEVRYKEQMREIFFPKNSHVISNFAAEFGNKEMVEFIIQETNFDVEKLDDSEKTALHYAARNPDLEVIKFLAENCKIDFDKQDILGKSALHYAASNKNIEVFKYVASKNNANVQITSNNGQTALHSAVFSNNPQAAEILVKQYGFNPDILDSEGKRPLDYAISEKKIQMVKSLVEVCNADVTYTDKQSKTPLHHAALSNEIEIVKTILNSKKIDVNAKDNIGQTALYCATHNDNSEIFKLLLKNKANLNVVNNHGQGIYSIAAPMKKKNITNLFDNKLGIIRRFLSNVLAPALFVAGYSYFKLTCATVSLGIGLLDYKLNGKKFTSVVLNGMLEIFTYTMVGIFTANFGIGFLIVVSAASNIALNILEEKKFDFVKTHTLRDSWVTSLKKEHQVSVSR